MSARTQPQPCFVGIDLGASACKTMAVDETGVVVGRTGRLEGGAYGAALVAGVGVDAWPKFSDAVGLSREARRVASDPARCEFYRQAHVLFPPLYPAFGPTFETLAVSREVPSGQS